MRNACPMGTVHEQITEALTQWVGRQHMFFVASAPLSADGHVNVSPKGLSGLRILGPRRVAYLDLTGSGVETIAHTNENGRITVMFCSFDGPPRIVRFHGRSTAWLPGSTGWDELRPSFPDLPGARAIIDIEVTRVSDSCGYSVPLYTYEGERERLVTWAADKSEDELREYRQKKNSSSIDGISGYLQ